MTYVIMCYSRDNDGMKCIPLGLVDGDSDVALKTCLELSEKSPNFEYGFCEVKYI